MQTLLLTLSLLFSANLFCEDAWTLSGLTYEDILWSKSIPYLKKEKARLKKELTQCSNPTQHDELQSKLNLVEKTIQSMVKQEEKELESYRKKVELYSLRDLESERDMYKRSLNTDPKYIDDIREKTNKIVKKRVELLESEIEKRKQVQ